METNIPPPAEQPATPEKSKQLTPSWWQKLLPISLVDKVFFTQHLALMLRSGLSLSAALKTLSSQAQSKYFQYVLVDIQRQVESGTSFSNAMARYPKVFSELMVSMVQVGESSGTLEQVLGYLTLQMKKEHELISKVKGALTYPAIVVSVMVLIGVFMLIFVIPKITEVFIEANAVLPIPTRILIFASKLIVHNILLATILTAAMITGVVKFSGTERGKLFFSKLTLILPIISPINKKVNLAQFARTVSSLLKSGVPIVDGFTITSKTLSNRLYRSALQAIGQSLSKGISVSASLLIYPKLFPSSIIEIVAIGEETGKIDEVLLDLAEFYEEDIDQIMKNLPTILEPVLMLMLGLGVGGMAVAILMPMYSLSNQIS